MVTNGVEVELEAGRCGLVPVDAGELAQVIVPDALHADIPGLVAGAHDSRGCYFGSAQGLEGADNSSIATTSALPLMRNESEKVLDWDVASEDKSLSLRLPGNGQI